MMRMDGRQMQTMPVCISMADQSEMDQESQVTLTDLAKLTRVVRRMMLMMVNLWIKW